MGQIKHYNNGKWTIYTSGEDLSGYTGTTNTYYIGVNNTDGDLSKVNPDGELINLEKPNVGFTGFTYEIGQYVASEGGVIYHRYLSGNTQYYLVVDTEDLGSSIYWSNPATSPLSTNALSLWNGMENTNLIEAAGPAAGIDSGSAAMLCVNSTNNGKDDWYLPAIDELNKVAQNRWEINQGLISAMGTELSINEYWSSSEASSNRARVFNLISYTIGEYPKIQPESVRAVRKFSI